MSVRLTKFVFLKGLSFTHIFRGANSTLASPLNFIQVYTTTMVLAMDFEIESYFPTFTPPPSLLWVEDLSNRGEGGAQGHGLIGCGWRGGGGGVKVGAYGLIHELKTPDIKVTQNQ